MKKITLLAFACAMLMGNFSAAAQEVTYVEDPAQGYLFNRMQDNWFVEVDGGAGVLMSTFDSKQDFGKRLGLKGQVAVGKWFSPLLGIRVGGEFNQMIGVTHKYGLGYRPWNQTIGTYEGNALKPSKFNNIGAFGDVLFNATNWICGYKPGRFYNAVVYAGLGIHWVYEHEKTGAETRGDSWKYDGGAENPHSRNFSARFGLLNQFNVTKNIAINLDLRFEMLQESTDGHGLRTWNEYPSALVGVAYKFNKTEWNAPVVPVCPESNTPTLMWMTSALNSKLLTKTLLTSKSNSKNAARKKLPLLLQKKNLKLLSQLFTSPSTYPKSLAFKRT